MGKRYSAVSIRFARAFCATCRQYLEARFEGRFQTSHLKCPRCMQNAPVGSAGRYPLGGSLAGIPCQPTGMSGPKV